MAFSQMYESSMYLSPSFTGFTSGGRLGLNYRNQWPGAGRAYQFYGVSIDHYFAPFNSGVGFTFLRDDQGRGLLVDDELSFLYSYEFTVAEDLYLRPGIAFKYAQRRIDPSKVTLPEDIDPGGVITPGQGAGLDLESHHNSRFDAAASLMFYGNAFWVGAAFDHLVGSDISFTDLKTKIGLKSTIYGGYKFVYSEPRRHSDAKTITVAFNYRHQYDFNQFDFGAYWYFNPIEIGLWYRGLPVKLKDEITNVDAIIPSVGVNVGDIRIGYSYDLTLSGLAGYSKGSHEISLIYRFNQNMTYTPSRKPVPCTEPVLGYGFGGSKYKRKTRRIF
jgi:type IX secretion system PorP/SprF family membrane protein